MGSGDEFMHLPMHRSGLSYIQSDLDPGDVRSIVFIIEWQWLNPGMKKTKLVSNREAFSYV